MNFTKYLTVHLQTLRFDIWGHSTTTWTNFDPILTPSPPRVDNRGHSTYPPPCPRGQKGQKKPPHKIFIALNTL